MTEETVGDGAPVVNDQLAALVAKMVAQAVAEALKSSPVIRSIPRGEFTVGSDIQEALGLSDEIWNLCKSAGLRTRPVTRSCEFMITDWLFDWAESDKPMPSRRPHRKRK